MTERTMLAGRILLGILVAFQVFLWLEDRLLSDLARMLVVASAGGVAVALPAWRTSGPPTGGTPSARAWTLDAQLPDLIDLMVTCLDAGIGADLAFRRSAAAIQKTSPDLCRAMEPVLKVWHYGGARLDALREMEKAKGCAEIAEFLSVVSEGGWYGTTIRQDLIQQSVRLREARLIRAREWAGKVPVFTVLAALVFVLPSVFAVLLGPSLLHLVWQFFPGAG